MCAVAGHSAGRGTTCSLKPNSSGVMRPCSGGKWPTRQRRQVRMAAADLVVEQPAAVPENIIEQDMGQPAVDSGERPNPGKPGAANVGGRREHREHLRGIIRHPEGFGQLVPGMGEEERMHDRVRARRDLPQASVHFGCQRKHEARHHADHPQRIAARLVAPSRPRALPDRRAGGCIRRRYPVARCAYVSGAARRAVWPAFTKPCASATKGSTSPRVP